MKISIDFNVFKGQGKEYVMNVKMCLIVSRVMKLNKDFGI